MVHLSCLEPFYLYNRRDNVWQLPTTAYNSKGASPVPAPVLPCGCLHSKYFRPVTIGAQTGPQEELVECVRGGMS